MIQKGGGRSPSVAADVLSVGGTLSDELSPGEVAALAEAFSDEASARSMLRAAGLARARHPSWSVGDAEQFWSQVSELVSCGIMKHGRSRILTEAHRKFPGNAVFNESVTLDSTMLPSTGTRVLISSTSGDLGRYQQAAIDVCYRLQLAPVTLQDLSTFGGDEDTEWPRQNYFQLIILLTQKGNRASGRKNGFLSSATSIHEWAVSQHIPVHIFEADPHRARKSTDFTVGISQDDLFRNSIRKSGENGEIHAVNTIREFREQLVLSLRDYTGSSPCSSADAPSRAPLFRAIPPYVASQPFTGRADELESLDGWARSSDPMLVVEAVGGVGKSALTWAWANERAIATIEGLSGCLWWSFYEGSASTNRFLREALSYMTGRPIEDYIKMDPDELLYTVIGTMRTRPFLFVLDGFERLLAAYHRFNPADLRDDQVNPSARSMIDHRGWEMIRAMASAAPSKVLISTRLLPDALTGPAKNLIDGVRHIRLHGLQDQEAILLSSRLGLVGDPETIRSFFARFGNHPLLIGVVAGLIRDYRRAPADFERWLADPEAGGRLRLSDLPLTQRRTHILDVALNNLDSSPRRLLGWIAALPGPVDFDVLENINPFVPRRPQRWAPSKEEFSAILQREERKRVFARVYRRTRQKNSPFFDPIDTRLQILIQKADAEHRAALAAWESGEEIRRSAATLDGALESLESRGLLWWDRATNSYDLHPVIRAFALDSIDEDEKTSANRQIRDHFSSLPGDALESANSIEDLRQTITIFRAMVGAGELTEAQRLYESGLHIALRFRVAAYTTIVELLEPLASEISPGTVTHELGAAYASLERIEDSQYLHYSNLHNFVSNNSNINATRVSLENIRASLDCIHLTHFEAGQLIAAERALGYEIRLDNALEDEFRGVVALRRASLATKMGRMSTAHQFAKAARRYQDPARLPSLTDDLSILRASIELENNMLTRPRLDELRSSIQFPDAREDAARIETAFWLDQGEFGRAITGAEEWAALRLAAGRDPLPARVKIALAMCRSGDIGAAAHHLDDILAANQAASPSATHRLDLAELLFRLRDVQADEVATEAYRDAWCDGPPYCDHWLLRKTKKLIAQMGIDVPTLPVVDPSMVQLTHEDLLVQFLEPPEPPPTVGESTW